MAEENKEEVKTDESRKDLIAKAADAIEKGEEKEEIKEEEVSEETEKEEAETPDPEEAKNALNLFRALNDPIQGPKILSILAKEAGLTKDSTPSEKKEITRTIKDVVKEKLGSEYQFLADRMGDTLEEVISSAVDKRVKEVEERLNLKDREELGNKIDNALNTCFAQYESVPKVVQEAFNALIDEMPPVPGKTDPLKYFNRLIKTAFEETNTKPVMKKVSEESKDIKEVMKERLLRNKRDVSSRLTSKGAEAEVETSRSTSSPVKSRREAIERADREFQESQKK